MSDNSSTDRDVVVVDRGGSSLGIIVGVIIALILAGAIWYFGFGPGQGTFGGTTDQGNDINVNVELPSVEPAAS